MPPASPQPNLNDDQAPLTGIFWLLLAATGLLAGLVGGALMRLLYTVERLAFAYHGDDFLAGVRNASAGRKLTSLLCAGVLAGVVLSLTRRLRGDTDLDGAIWKRSGYLPIGKSSIKGLLSILIVGLGASIGRENALKQAGGIIANVFARWRALPDEQRRLLVACGGGAGMAAAYNVPLGGAVFAMEILLGSFSIRTAMPALGCSLLATWASWLLLPDRASYTFVAAGASVSLVVWAALAGPACGLLAIPFVRLLAWAKARKPSGWWIAAAPVMSLTLVGLASIKVPELLGNGKEVVQVALLNSPGVGLLLTLLVVRPLATAIILRSGAPGGLFTPTMSLGAVAGLLLGRGWATIFPHSAAAGQMPTCALIGAAALLSAATQGPLSSAIFMLELTRTADSTMVPLLLAVVSASVVTRLFEERSIYAVESANKIDS